MSQRHLTPVDLYLISEKSISEFLVYFKLDFHCLCTAVQPTKINFKIDFCRLKIQFVELDFSNLIF